jgi:hypothetical protein
VSQVRSCDGGCGTTDQYGALTRLTRVQVTIGTEKAQVARQSFEADLCDVCQQGMLRGYFAVRAPADPFEVPAWLRGAA